ncbi:hypothetical protein Q8A67_013506 [Cirrhinus molitorella]|uniref:Uncharacterized protein n=1 Tax=Cirrhinus molitorella TaxID=172907 RepID=A0AA88TV83_9TELE|nr:hypothetical protein Q8A67_013506 [Cirrhinus molitorella]
MWGRAAFKSFLMAVHLEENKTRSAPSLRNPHTLRLLSPHAALWLARSHRIDGHEDVYKRHGFPSGSGVGVCRESFIMGWKSWGEGPAALRKPSERSSGWQHHLLGKTGKTEEGNKERKQHESSIMRHKHQQWSSKKMGNVSLNRTLDPHLQAFSLFPLRIPLFLWSQTRKDRKGLKYRSGANGRFFPSLLWDWAGVVYGCGTLGERRQRQRFLGRRPERKNEGPREKKREGSVPFIMK